MRKRVTFIVIAALITGIAVVIGSMPGALAHPGHSISVNDVSASEGGGTGTFTLTLTPAPESGESVSVDVVTANGSALGSSSCAAAPGSSARDYVSVPKTKLTFTSGETSKTQSVTICPDATDEGNETFFLNLSGATSTCVAPCITPGATISRFQGTGTIVDDESRPSLRIGNNSSFEGPVGTLNFPFSVTLSARTSSVVTVHYITGAGTADSGGDYQARSGTLTFPANSTTPRTINVPVYGDTASETDETFFVNIFDAAHANIADPQGVGIIENDDAPPSGTNAFKVDDVTRPEGNTFSSPTTPFTFTVTLGRDPGAGHTARVNYHVTEGTATSGVDYDFISGTLIFGASESAKTITVAVFGDTTDEPNETFFVNLSGNACSGTACSVPAISDDQGKGTVNDDDVDTSPTPTPSPTPTAGGSVFPTVKIAGYFQVRVTAASPCSVDRFLKVKKSVPGTDKVIVTGRTNSSDVFKQAVRPKKTGKFYAQVYEIKIQGTTCRGGKSPVRTLPA